VADKKRAAATAALRRDIADSSLSKNELKKCIRRAEKGGADADVVVEATRIKSTKLSQSRKAAAVVEEEDQDEEHTRVFWRNGQGEEHTR